MNANIRNDNINPVLFVSKLPTSSTFHLKKDVINSNSFFEALQNKGFSDFDSF